MLTWEETRRQLTEGIAKTYRRNGEPFSFCHCGWPTRSPAGVCGVCLSLYREEQEARKTFFKDPPR